MNPLRVGVIGLGAFGESHIRAYSGLTNVELAAVSSRSADRAAEIGDRYSIPARYGDHAALIADPSIQAVSITTAEFEHRDLAIAALQSGKHVLVEKPIASTLDDAYAMQQVAREADTILMPGHILRFHPAYAQLRQAAVAGDFGRVVAMHARRNRPQSLIATHGRVHPALITAIHDIDIMLWIVQSPVRSVYAVDRIATRDDGAHGLWGMIEFANGIIATIETSWLMPATSGTATDDAFHVTGMTGAARIQLDTPTLRMGTTNGIESPDVSYEPALHGVITGALRDELAHFVQCALTSTPSSIVTPEDGVNALSVVLALIESTESKQPITPSAVPPMA